MSKNNEFSTIKHSIFMLLCQLEHSLAENITKDKIDSQAIFALSKLVDSFIKLSDAEMLRFAAQNMDQANKMMTQDDQSLLALYREDKVEISEEIWLPGPDSNQRPSG